MEILELKRTTTEIKNSMDGLNSRIEMAQEKKISVDLKAQQLKLPNVNNRKKINRVHETCGTISKGHQRSRRMGERVQCMNVYSSSIHNPHFPTGNNPING